MLGLDEDNTYKENSRIELTEKDVDEGVDDSLSHLLPLIWELYKFIEDQRLFSTSITFKQIKVLKAKKYKNIV